MRNRLGYIGNVCQRPANVRCARIAIIRLVTSDARKRPTAAGGPLEVPAEKPTLASAHWRPFVLAYAAAVQRMEPLASARFLAVQLHNLCRRSAAVRVGRQQTPDQHSMHNLSVVEAAGWDTRL